MLLMVEVRVVGNRPLGPGSTRPRVPHEATGLPGPGPRGPGSHTRSRAHEGPGSQGPGPRLSLIHI